MYFFVSQSTLYASKEFQTHHDLVAFSLLEWPFAAPKLSSAGFHNTRAGAVRNRTVEQKGNDNERGRPF